MTDKNKKGFNRRDAGRLLLAGGGSLASLMLPGRAISQRNLRGFGPEVPERQTFFFTQLMYGKDMSWNPHPTAVRSLMEMLTARTSVPASKDRTDIRVSDKKFFHHPFIYWTGTREFAPFPEEDIERLRLFLEMGGFMLVDDALCTPGVGFDKAFQRELSRIFPGKGLAKLPEDHTTTQSYYLIERAAGRTANRPYLSGIDIGDRTALIHSANDMGGAWARDRSGKWSNPVTPGGDYQRERAIRLGINIILYSLCLDYKKDLVHVPTISERRKGGKRSP